MPRELKKNKLIASNTKAMSVDRENFTLTATMSTRSVDRDGDIVEPSGMDVTEFQQNPVVLWAHDSSAPPIAKVEEVLTSHDSVMGVLKFDQNDPYAAMIFNKFADGFMNAFSVGFTATEQPEPISDGEKITGLHFQKTKLYELSAVPVPANPEALVREVNAMEGKQAARFVKGLLDSKTSQKAEVIETLKSLQEKAFTHNNEVKEDEPVWGSIKKTTLPRKAFVWEASGTDPEKKSTWRYPHHWVANPGDKDANGVYTSGTMYLHKQGLGVAYAAAMGARTGAEAEPAIIRHLEKHRKALGLKQMWFMVMKDNELVTYKINAEEKEKNTEDENIFEKVDLEFTEKSFAKTVQEIASQGNIISNLQIGDELELGIGFEILNEKESGDITEVKIVQVGKVHQLCSSSVFRDGVA